MLRTFGIYINHVERDVVGTFLTLSRILPLLIAFAICSLLSTNQGFAQSKPATGSVTAVKGKNFGRLIFNLDKLPEYTYKLSGTILVLKFSERVDVNVGLVTEKLDQYIGVARRDPDGLAIRFALTDVFKLNVTNVGANLFLDILPTDWVGMPPSLPKDVLEELSRAAEAAAFKAEQEARQREETKKSNRVKLRVAIHPTFSRMVFDWNTFATVEMSRQGSRVNVKFGRHARLDLAQLKADPPPYVYKVALVKNLEGLEVEFLIDPIAKIRGFREGIDYVLDISGPYSDLDLSVRNARDKIAERYELKKLSEGNKDATSPQESRLSGEKKNKEEKKTKKPKEKMKVPIKVKSTYFDSESFDKEEFGDLDSVFSSDGEDFNYNQVWRGALRPGELNANKRGKKAKKKKVRVGRKNKKVPGKAGKVSDDEDEPDEAEQILKVTTKKNKRNLEIVFPFSKPVAAAIFQRSHIVTVVLDADQDIESDNITKNSGGMVSAVNKEFSEGSTIIRLKLAKRWLAYAKLKDNNWHVVVGDMVRGDLKPLRMSRAQMSDKTSYARIPYKKPGLVHWIKDPDFGDDLAVVTGFGPTRGFVKTHKLVDFHSLATAHGVAIKPLAGDLSVQLRVDEVVLSRRKGLFLSAENVYQKLARRKVGKKNQSRVGFIDFKNWQKGGAKFFSRRVAELEREIAFAKPKRQNKKRKELARLYLSHELAPETLGVIKQIINADATSANDPSVNILRGAANVMMNRNSEARDYLDVHGLAFDPNAALWRAHLAANEKQWPVALKQFSEGKSQIPSYPPYMQARFRLLEAKAALAVRQWKRAADSLDAIPKVALPKAIEAETHLLRGRYFQLIGEPEKAQKSYDQVVALDSGAHTAEAEFNRINMKLAEKEITNDQATKALERLSIIWRGDEIELHTLHRLSDLYSKDKKYRQAFEVMRSTILAFPKAKEALQIQDEMKEVFTDLFLYGKADNISPIKALSLYYDYKELTPVGRLGDELIRRLSSRLMAVDLLDQATELLDYQVKNRLNGYGRAQVAARLAMIHLMNRKPALALRTIRETRQPDLPNHLKRQRDILEARSLGELGRVENTIDILSKLEGYDVARLRADAFWKAHRWQRAGELLEEMLGARWRRKEPLSDIERFDVLRSAISYSLAEDQFALDRIRSKFYEKMKNSSDAESFVLVTTPIQKRGVDFDKLAKEIASYDTLDAFIKEYRERFDRIEGKSAQNKQPEQAG